MFAYINRHSLAVHCISAIDVRKMHTSTYRHSGKPMGTCTCRHHNFRIMGIDRENSRVALYFLNFGVSSCALIYSQPISLYDRQVGELPAHSSAVVGWQMSAHLNTGISVPYTYNRNLNLENEQIIERPL